MKVPTITTSNYFDVVDKFGVPDVPALKSSAGMMEAVSASNWAAYQTDSDIRETTDLYFSKLQSFLSKPSDTPEPRPQRQEQPKQEPAPKKAPAPKAKKAAPTKASKPTKQAKAGKQTKSEPKAASSGAKSAAGNASAPKSAAKATKAPKKVVATATTGTGVAKLSAAVAFLRRYLLFVNKDVELTRVNALLRSLQTNITEQLISKKDKSAPEITKIQDLLVKVVNKAKTVKVHIEADQDTVAKLAQMAGGEHVYGSIPVIKAFIRFAGKRPTEKQLDNLAARALKASQDEDDPYREEAKTIIKWTGSNKVSERVYFEKAGLSGLSGKNATEIEQLAGVSASLDKYSRHAAVAAQRVARTAAKRTAAAAGRGLLRASGHAGSCGCGGHGAKKKSPLAPVEGIGRVSAPAKVTIRRQEPAVVDKNAIMSSSDLMRKQFKVIEMYGKWRTLIGKPEEGFKVMFWGKPGQGKSTGAIDLARYLAEYHGPTLYVSAEEPGSLTLQDKLARMGGSVPDLYFSGFIPCHKGKQGKYRYIGAGLENYKYLFVDSVNTFKLLQEDFKNIAEAYPRLAIVLIFQATKEGNFKGAQEWEHDVDVVIRLEAGQAMTQKNRFGSLTSITIF